MNTTAPDGTVEETEATTLLERLEAVDAADAPAVADELARALAARLDESDAEPNRQLSAAFDGETDR